MQKFQNNNNFMQQEMRGQHPSMQQRIPHIQQLMNPNNRMNPNDRMNDRMNPNVRYQMGRIPPNQSPNFPQRFDQMQHNNFQNIDVPPPQVRFETPNDYLDKIKLEYSKTPEVYFQFLELMNDFKQKTYIIFFFK